MIVFILLGVIILLVLIIFLLVSSFFKINIKNLEIKDFEDLKNICILIKEKKYTEIFEYINLILNMQICIFDRIPILSIKLSNIKLKQLINKQMQKADYEIIKNKQKMELKKIMPTAHVENINLQMSIGTIDASITALAVSVINIVIAFIVPAFAEYGKPEDYQYEVKPIYLDKGFFNTKLSAGISLYVLDIIKSFSKVS